MNQPQLTFDDRLRLRTQSERVLAALASGQWVTLAELARIARGSEAGVSARLRELRKLGHVVDRERVAGGNGLHRYRLAPAPPWCPPSAECPACAVDRPVYWKRADNAWRLACARCEPVGPMEVA